MLHGLMHLRCVLSSACIRACLCVCGARGRGCAHVHILMHVHMHVNMRAQGCWTSMSWLRNDMHQCVTYWHVDIMMSRPSCAGAGSIARHHGCRGCIHWGNAVCHLPCNGARKITASGSCSRCMQMHCNWGTSRAAPARSYC